MSGTLEQDPRLQIDEPGLGGVLDGYRRRLTSGDLGQLPVILGIIVIWAIFAIASGGNFVKPGNLVNLSLQMAAVGTIAVGVVFVLLLGEIDLTVGVVSGLAASVMAVVNTKIGLPGPLAVAIGVGVGVAIGLLHGFWITRFRIPSFVVTLAGLIGWQGAQLFVLGDTGTINMRDDFIVGLAGTFFPGIVGWLIGALFVLYVAVSGILGRRRRLRGGLPAEAALVVWIRVVIVAVLTAVALLVLGGDRGLPLSLVFLVGLVVIMDYVVSRTRFGRMIYAVGGNAEAARRSGIPVDRVRVAVFVLASAFAAWGGMLAASRLLAVNQSSGSGVELLNAIAAAVIGGASLFGGRGTIWAALLGILVIQSISNGMDLLAFPSPAKLMVTGAVLLAAVTIDALARRGRAAAGR
jgi:ABC-type xylose transport system, permease component